MDERSDSLESAAAYAVECFKGLCERVVRMRETLDRSVPREAMERRCARLQRQIDESHAALRRRKKRIGELQEHIRVTVDHSSFEHGILLDIAGMLGVPIYGDDGSPDAYLTELGRRLMPAGMEWPRFEDGEPVRVGDEVVDEAEELVYRVSEIAFSDGYGTCLRYEDQRDGNPYNFIDGLEPGERVKRPARKVLDADGVEIRVGEMVWDIHTGERMTIDGITGAGGAYETCRVTLESGEQTTCDGPRLTHARPDSWEKWREDSELSPIDYCVRIGYPPSEEESAELIKNRALVRRARRLAERGN